MIWYLDALQSNPQVFLVYFAAVAVAIFTGLAFHEFCHAWSAHELGDDTARRQGRMTLNPLVHLHPVGTILILLVGFGFARPTPVNTYALRYGPVRGGAIVSFAGPASNFFFAALAALPLRLGLVSSQFAGDFGISIEGIIRFGSGQDLLFLFLYFIVSLNIVLGLFNLIPLAPLDGFAVALALLPAQVAQPLSRLAPFGPGILMTLIMIGFVTPVSPIWWVLGGVNSAIFNLLL
jgi:Zn-dependent protease